MSVRKNAYETSGRSGVSNNDQQKDVENFLKNDSDCGQDGVPHNTLKQCLVQVSDSCRKIFSFENIEDLTQQLSCYAREELLIPEDKDNVTQIKFQIFKEKYSQLVKVEKDSQIENNVSLKAKIFYESTSAPAVQSSQTQTNNKFITNPSLGGSTTESFCLTTPTGEQCGEDDPEVGNSFLSNKELNISNKPMESKLESTFDVYPSTSRTSLKRFLKRKKVSSSSDSSTSDPEIIKHNVESVRSKSAPCTSRKTVKKSEHTRHEPRYLYISTDSSSSEHSMISSKSTRKKKQCIKPKHSRSLSNDSVCLIDISSIHKSGQKDSLKQRHISVKYTAVNTEGQNSLNSKNKFEIKLGRKNKYGECKETTHSDTDDSSDSDSNDSVKHIPLKEEYNSRKNKSSHSQILKTNIDKNIEDFLRVEWLKSKYGQSSCTESQKSRTLGILSQSQPRKHDSSFDSHSYNNNGKRSAEDKKYKHLGDVSRRSRHSSSDSTDSSRSNSSKTRYKIRKESRPVRDSSSDSGKFRFSFIKKVKQNRRAKCFHSEQSSSSDEYQDSVKGTMKNSKKSIKSEKVHGSKNLEHSGRPTSSTSFSKSKELLKEKVQSRERCCTTNSLIGKGKAENVPASGTSVKIESTAKLNSSWNTNFKAEDTDSDHLNNLSNNNNALKRADCIPAHNCSESCYGKGAKNYEKFNPYFDKAGAPKNPISFLYEVCAQEQYQAPIFELTKEVYSHNPEFRFKVTIDNVTYYGKKSFTKKQVAKAHAAECCLKSMGYSKREWQG